jgi:hypothetical protein
MSNAKSWLVSASILLTAAANGCSDEVEPAIVSFGDGTAIGTWSTQNSAGNGSTSSSASSGATPSYQAGAGTSGNVLTAPLDDKPSTSIGNTQSGAAAGSGTQPSTGTGGSTTAPTAGRNGNGISTGGRAAAGGTGGTTPEAGSGASAASNVTSLTFDVTTSAVGLQYQPKNIGAIWVTDASGKLVKSLEVWAATRRRYLTGYVSALAGSSVDVTASATLSSHRAHHASWDLRDKTGAAVPAGKYNVVIELTDGNKTGRTTSVSFDTSAGPTTLSPADAPSFTGIKLQLN